METFSTLSRKSPDIEQDEKIDLSVLLNCGETVSNCWLPSKKEQTLVVGGFQAHLNPFTETVKNMKKMAPKYAVGVFVLIWWTINLLHKVSIGLISQAMGKNYLQFPFFMSMFLKPV